MAYKVKSGDTVSQIAKRMGVRVQDIVAANPNLKDVNKIKVGQSLTIPKARTGKNIGSQGPYGRVSQTEMNMMRKSGEQYTTGVRAKMKAGAETSPTPKKKKATEEAKVGTAANTRKRAQELGAKKNSMPLPKPKPKNTTPVSKKTGSSLSKNAVKQAQERKDKKKKPAVKNKDTSWMDISASKGTYAKKRAKKKV
jgi:nucleoid-associated protein YgaU